MECKEIGLSLFGIGLAFQLLGLIASDRAMIGAGNLVAVVGVSLSVGRNAIGKNLPGVLLFCLGVLAVFRGLIFFGFILEMLGLGAMVNINVSIKGLFRKCLRKVTMFFI